MNIAYCEDEKIQLEYMEQLIRKWADEGNDTVTYFGYGSAKELLFEHPDSFPFDLLLLDIDMDGTSIRLQICFCKYLISIPYFE